MIKFRTYQLISRAVEEGSIQGWNKAHKHTDSPSKEVILQEIEHYIMLSLDEIINFDTIDN